MTAETFAALVAFAGIRLGVAALVFAVALGMGAVFVKAPRLSETLRRVGTAMLL